MENIIRTFKKDIFPYIDWFQVEKESDEESDEEIDITDIPDLETETSTAKKKKSTRTRTENTNAKCLVVY